MTIMASNADEEHVDPFEKYKVQTQIRLHQRGSKKGQEYKLFKFTDKKTGRLVKHKDVLTAAKIKFGKPYKTESYLPGQQQRARIVTTLKIKNYVRQKDTEWGRAETEADEIEHYRTEVSSDVKDEFDAFNYKKAMGGEKVHRSYLYDNRGDRIYGGADVEIVETRFY